MVKLLNKPTRKHSVIEGAAGVNPAADVKRFFEKKTKLRILDDDEVFRLLHMANPELTPILKILLTTAMRPHEVFTLRWEYPGWDKEKTLPAPIVSLKWNLIHIPATVAKNHKDRELDLSPELRTMFETMSRSESGKVFRYNSMPKSFRAAVKDAKLINVTLYTLKHTAISRMIRAGIDLVTISELVGHADVKTTMIYCHANRETKREAVTRMSRIYLAPAAEPPAVEAENERTIAGQSCH